MVERCPTSYVFLLPTPPPPLSHSLMINNHNSWFSAPPLPGRDDQRLSDHACGLRPGEDQGSGHLQQPAAEQEAQEGGGRGQKRIDGLSESVRPCRLMSSKESTGILDLFYFFKSFCHEKGRLQSQSWTFQRTMVEINSSATLGPLEFLLLFFFLYQSITLIFVCM